MKYFRLIFCLFLLINFTSCKLTNSLWNRSYHEKLHYFLATSDSKQIVFLAQNYHYVFNDNSGRLKSLLFWRNRGLLLIDFSQTQLKLHQDNSIEAHVVVRSLFKNLYSSDYSYLKSLGFIDKGENMEIVLHLKGKRYLPKSGVNYQIMPLNKEYDFQVSYDPTVKEKIAIVALTPITIAVDATLWLGGSVLLAPFKN